MVKFNKNQAEHSAYRMPTILL